MIFRGRTPSEAGQGAPRSNDVALACRVAHVGVTVGPMSDRVFFSLALAAAVVMIALATVWP
jgi:hypothetical protein